jgi:hypothetical protein
LRAVCRMTGDAHGVKQVGQPLSNQGIDIDAAPRHFVPYAVGPRGGINVARDWTDFDAAKERS